MQSPANIVELKHILDEAGILPSAYSFVSDGSGECYRLEEFQDELGRGWHYYYAERGQRTGLVTFRDEAEACSWFLSLILRDTLAFRR